MEIDHYLLLLHLQSFVCPRILLVPCLQEMFYI